MQFNEVAKKNMERCGMWHQKGGLTDWSPLEWAAAMTEEAGELMEAVVQLVITASRVAGFIKKMRRLESGINASNNSATVHEARDKVRKELGDLYLYADLVAQSLGLEMEDCVVYAFNMVSAREKLPVLLIPATENGVSVDRAVGKYKEPSEDFHIGKPYQAPDPRDNREILYEACNARLKEKVESLEKELANMHERAVNFEHNAVQYKKAFEEKTAALRASENERQQQGDHMLQQRHELHKVHSLLAQERDASSHLRIEVNSKDEQLKGLRHMLDSAREILKTL